MKIRETEFLGELSLTRSHPQSLDRCQVGGFYDHGRHGKMRADTAVLKKTYIRVPPITATARWKKVARALVGSVLSPAYWLLAHRYHVPGLRFRLDCARLGLRLLYNHKAPVSYPEIYSLLFWPMDSTRYFEFDFMWHSLYDIPFRYYLDVSSPRLFPIILSSKRPEITAELVNPDKKDLQDTARFVRACGIDSRCHLRDCRIEEAPFSPESFDVITSISVVEHIPQDKDAVNRMWELLKPGGKLVLSVPCAAVAEEQYLDVDHFGLQTPDENGFLFHQYIYDQALLMERFYSVVGPPVRLAIYGETKAGTLLNGLIRKWSGQDYPLWKEPYAMAREFRRYESLSDLPGEGVIMMEFVKE
jgi:predicted SAM-dependent methyltransferase